MTSGVSSGWVERVRGVQRGTAAIVGAGMLLAACGDDGGEAGADDGSLSVGSSESTTTDTGLPSCRDVENVVVFSVFGTATMGDGDELSAWADDPDAEPTARPGAAEVVGAYRELGYEILYVTSQPASTVIGDRPLVDAVTVWLGTNDFPVGDEARVWAADGEGEPSVALIEELARLSVAGAELDTGYAADQDGVFPLVSGGISRDRVYVVDAEAADAASTSLQGEDLGAHVPEVQALDPVCE